MAQIRRTRMPRSRSARIDHGFHVVCVAHDVRPAQERRGQRLARHGIESIVAKAPMDDFPSAADFSVSLVFAAVAHLGGAFPSCRIGRPFDIDRRAPGLADAAARPAELSFEI